MPSGAQQLSEVQLVVDHLLAKSRGPTTVRTMDRSLLIDVPAKWISSGRIADVLTTDRERALRLASSYLLWLNRFDDDARRKCLEEVLDAVEAGEPVAAVLARWAPAN